MERFPSELLYVLAFLAVILFNFIAQRAARRRQQQKQPEQPLPPAPAPIEEEVLEDIWGRKPAAAALVAPTPAPTLVHRAPPRPRRVHPVRALLKDRRDLRRAVVLTMVLGPCRAQDPSDR
jgi:hypothetical protein